MKEKERCYGVIIWRRLIDGSGGQGAVWEKEVNQAKRMEKHHSTDFLIQFSTQKLCSPPLVFLCFPKVPPHLSNWYEHPQDVEARTWGLDPPVLLFTHPNIQSIIINSTSKLQLEFIHISPLSLLYPSSSRPLKEPQLSVSLSHSCIAA